MPQIDNPGVTPDQLNDATRALSDHIDSEIARVHAHIDKRTEEAEARINTRLDGIERLLVLLARDAGFKANTIVEALDGGR